MLGGCWPTSGHERLVKAPCVAHGTKAAQGVGHDDGPGLEVAPGPGGDLNNVVEADHGKLKQLIRPVRGFKTLKTAYARIKGFEVMRALRKGQARMFAIQGGIVGETRIVERAFGVGPCVLTEVITLLQDRLASAKT